MLNFSNAAGYTGVIPAGTMLMGVLNVEELRKASTGNDYLNVRLDVTAPAQFEGRKLWTNIMLTQDGGGAPSGVGYSQVKAVLECNGADPVAAPEKFTFPDFAAVARALSGASAAVRVGVEDTPDGGQRNTVKVFIRPNPASGTRGMFDQLNASMGIAAPKWPPATVQITEPPQPQAPVQPPAQAQPVQTGAQQF